MSRILAAVAFTLVILVGGVAVYVQSQPGTLHAERTIMIDAPASEVTPFGTDLKLFNDWSPWRDVDPDLTFQYADVTAGEGAWYSWDGNDEAGAGKQTLIEVGPGRSVSELAFSRPFEGRALATLVWSDDGEGAKVVWAFDQEAGFGTKAANLVMDIEGMIGGDYERGLKDLKVQVEAAHAKRRAAEEAEQARVAAEAAKNVDPTIVLGPL